MQTKQTRLNEKVVEQNELNYLRTLLPMRPAATQETSDHIDARIWALTIKLDQTA